MLTESEKAKTADVKQELLYDAIVEKNALRGIIYPLAIRMWENGRPTTEDIRNFKADATAQLKTRFDDLVKEVFIESIL